MSGNDTFMLKNKSKNVAESFALSSGEKYFFKPRGLLLILLA